MVRVLVADSNVDSHELIHDILQINFRDAKIERAHNCESFMNKISQAEHPYNLILYSMQMDAEAGNNTLSQFFHENPKLLKHTVLMTENVTTKSNPHIDRVHTIRKPYSLDHFGEVIKKACAT
jgi:DNA-binding NtrC family response regulator